MTFSMLAMMRLAVPATSIGGMSLSVCKSSLSVRILVDVSRWQRFRERREGESWARIG
jgi:hypothetical protein